MHQRVVRTGLAAGSGQRALMRLQIVARLPAPSVLALSVHNGCIGFNCALTRYWQPA